MIVSGKLQLAVFVLAQRSVVLFMPFGVRVLAKPMKYCSLAHLALLRSLCICSIVVLIGLQKKR